MRLSYKPQRLVLERGQEKLKVREYIQIEVGDKPSDTEFKRVLSSLGIERNLER